jgi:hypothetical protein
VLGAALAAAVAAAGPPAGAAAPPRQEVAAERRGPAADPGYRRAADRAVAALLERHGPAERGRIERGAGQVLQAWRRDDGDPEALRVLLEEEFLPAGAGLDATFDRLEFAFERIGGYFNSMTRDLRRGLDLDLGPPLPIDRRLAELDPGAHVVEDLFRSRVAFVILLNFPRTALRERLEAGPVWSRRRWAEARLAQSVASRVPAEALQRAAAAYAAAESYINDYNIYMHHLLTPDGERPFPEGLRLITHWGLRDELKARYADPAGLARQRLIQKVMERIVLQEIPRAVINNPLLDWTPETNAVRVSPARDAGPPPGARPEARPDREPDERYRRWQAIFRAERAADPFHPDTPTFIARRFESNREIPEAEVRRLFEEVLASPLGARVARLIAARLGRPLEPFDIWYTGFRPRARHAEETLDAVTRERYPTAAAYAADMPRMLRRLGFSRERARFLAGHIVVEPSRGAGHALGALRRDDRAHLRTRVGRDGMDYKGYNIAVHEMGHNVEQVFSMTTIDRTLLQGVPNNAFTEALAFVFQARDLELLGLAGPDPGGGSLRALDVFWSTREIAGVALVDMASWRWLYEHPEATAAQFREAVVRIARDLWNRHYAPVVGGRDLPLLAIYSHMINGGMYTPDYPLGHLIAFQIEAHFRTRAGAFGEEFERLCRIGRVTPDLWMRQAVGAPLSAAPLLQGAAEALAALGDGVEAPGAGVAGAAAGATGR